MFDHSADLALRSGSPTVVQVSRGSVNHAQSSRERRLQRWPALIGAVLLGLALAGCSIPIADLPLVGLPANTPARPATTAEYPAVHDIPAARAEAVLTPEQQDKIEKDLVAARNRQTSGLQKASQGQN